MGEKIYMVLCLVFMIAVFVLAGHLDYLTLMGM